MKTYNCKNCGAPLKWVPGEQRLYCKYCNQVYTPDEMEEQYKINQDMENYEPQSIENLKVYKCCNCDGEIVGDIDTVSTVCPYCGSSISITENELGEFHPKYTLPFYLKKEDAVKAFDTYKKTRSFAIEGFENAEISSIQGFYIPFFLYSSKMNVKVHTESGGEGNKTQEYFAMDCDIKKYPINASRKMNMDLIQSVNPFDYKKIKPYHSSDLAGFITERWNMKEENTFSKYKGDAVSNIIEWKTRERKINGVYQDKKIDVKNENYDYTMVPIWIVRALFNGKTYLIYINGQTGEVAGDLPVSKSKAGLFKITYFLVFSPIFVAITFLLSCLFGGA